MNTKDINNSNAAGNRRAYLSPRTEIITMDTKAGMMETISIPRIIDSDSDEAYGKQWQGDDSDSWDEVETNTYKKPRSLW